ncbi:MAG TPA: hypothetical protein PKJ63_01125 [Cyclobacteriaceae bacterium]|nr:hypothetical protein [Cyclobacteriaceae bacterium]
MNLFRVIVNLFHFNRTNWKAVSLCFLAAVVFWFFNALNKNYSTNLRFAVNFDFDEQRYIPVEPLPRSVFMNVSGNGWDLLRKSLGFNVPEMNIPLERPTEVKKIVGSTLPALLAGQLGNLQINHVVTDTLYLSLDPKERKKVKVTVDPSQFTFAEGFGRLSPVVVLPDSISLEGPKSVLAKVADSVTLSFEQRAIEKDYREEVEVNIPNGELIKRDPAVVEVMFEVVEWVEVTKPIRLDVINVPSGIRVNLVKDSVRCVVKVPRSQVQDFARASEGELALLNLRGVRRGDSKILPEVIGLPGHVQLVRVDSVSLRLY